jgi:hypothetical protein
VKTGAINLSVIHPVNEDRCKLVKLGKQHLNKAGLTKQHVTELNSQVNTKEQNVEDQNTKADDQSLTFQPPPSPIRTLKNPTVTHSTNTNKSSHKNDNSQLLEALREMMAKQTQALEEKLKRQNDQLSKRIEAVAVTVAKISDERKQQLDAAGQIIKQGLTDGRTDPVTKTAYEIVEAIRKAAEGDVGGLMLLAYSLTPQSMRPQNDGVVLNIPKWPRDLHIALENILPRSSHP